ncbi:MAG TPA: hypothetical protein PLF84_05395, partial [Bryobacteraceae bacterium]|nr:hypothetical protein [Bryobacteraceae bacterium]
RPVLNEFFEDQRLPVLEVGPLDLAPLRRARSDLLCSDIVFFTSIQLERGDWRDPNRWFLEVVDSVGNIVEKTPSTGPGGNRGADAPHACGIGAWDRFRGRVFAPVLFLLAVSY